MTVLEVKNLTHTYSGNTPFINDAVSRVSFSVQKGEIIGIIGHTGSGKSTLVQHLNGLLKPSEGTITVGGVRGRGGGLGLRHLLPNSRWGLILT